MRGKTMKRIVMTIISLLAVQAFSADFIWWEGENPADTNLPEAKSQRGRAAEVLSGGKWLQDNSVAKQTDGPLRFVEYNVRVPKAATYDFFVRKFWKHGPFRWRFDNGDWHVLEKDNTTLLDYVQIKPKLGACWIPLGAVKLEAGEHRLRIELTRGKGPACLDAFLLTTTPFIPRGKLKPDAPFPEPKPGWFNVKPQDDAFTASPIDLRPLLNEPVAGSKGFIRAEGEHFVHSKTGEPVRFWAVNGGNAIADQPRHYVDKLARYLAKRGVNMIRLHGGMYHGRGANAGSVDEQHLDNVFYFTKAMNEQGIYVHFSIHFQHWLRLNENPDFPEYAKVKNGRPHAIHYFSPEYQKVYRSWWDALFGRKSPYTGKTLAETPGVSSAELLNEDSFFFWTFKPYETVPAKHMAILERRFHDWLVKRYGALKSMPWHDHLGKLEGDDAAAKRVGLYSAAMLTGQDWAVRARNQKRAEDCARFLAEVQRNFYDEHMRYLKKELGFGGMVVASNWKVADPAVLEPIEHWTNAGVDFFDHHGYFGGGYKSAGRRGSMLDAGDQYRENLMVRLGTGLDGKGEPASSLPFIDMIIDGKPSMVSEFTWLGFRPSRCEMPLFVASQASLSGMDAMVFFALGTGPGWDPQIDSKWPLKSPTDVGQFPAAALIYRTGMLEEAPAAAEVVFNTDSVLALGGSPVVSSSIDDDNRNEEGDGRGALKGVLDPMLTAVGPVKVRYSDDQKTQVLRTVDLSKLHNPKAGTLTTLTGQQRWEYRRGIYVVDSPKAQCVTGILADAGTVVLADLTINSGMPFGTVMVVSMDGKPIATSSKILVQVMSRMLNNGWKTKPGKEGKDWEEIVSTGQAPTILEEFSGKIKFNRPDAKQFTVTALDLNGYPLSKSQGADALDLQKDVIYYVLETK